MPTDHPFGIGSGLAGGVIALSAIMALDAHGAQDATPLDGASCVERYRTPSAEIVGILDTEPLPFVEVSPTGSHMLLLRRESMPPLAELAQPMLRLAGSRINPDLNAPHGPRSVVGIAILEIGSGREIQVGLPPDVGISMQDWSPAGDSFIFTVTDRDGVALWIGDVATGRARPLTPPRVNALGPGAGFLADGRSVLVAMIPEGRGPAPKRSPVPLGPNVQENRGGGAAPVRTYQDLLQGAHDEALFEHYFTAQLMEYPVAAGDAAGSAAEGRPLGPPAIFLAADPSPTGKHVLIQRVLPPFPRHVPMGEFARSVEVWSRDGRQRQVVARLPVADRVPTGGVLTGPRGHRWRDTVGTEELLWVEALDGGNPRQKVEHRDRLMIVAAPFDGQARELLRTAGRLSGVTWIGDRPLALVSDFERSTRWGKGTLIDVSDASVAPREIFSRNTQDRYADPGSPMTTRNAAGRRVARFSEGAIYLASLGATPEGNRPFIDRFALDSGTSARLWRNTDESYERVVGMVGDGGRVILTRRETPTEPPNYMRLDLGSGERRALTAFPHPAPQLKEIRRELVRYPRGDGVELTATLYLPPGHVEGRRLPLILWAYPQEFNDAATASQVTDSPYEFTMFGGSSHLFLLLEGYAIMDRAAMPVVGPDPDTVNDSFIEQIVSSAKAAIDHADALGVGDPSRVGVGGHSYGAFMTANLLAHSDLFRAGIARSGAFNRTLTPFGFQAEQRSLWEAPEVYVALSPFMHANTIQEPLLLIHGEIDNNPGTFPMQSERLYHAVVGHSGTARLVMLPHESHGYRARESVLHVLAEMIDWFNEFVRDAPGEERTGSPTKVGRADAGDGR